MCCAYLADVPSNSEAVKWEQKSKRDRWERQFKSSRWFTRGWTLQELIAPESLVFYADDWSEIGTKRSLLDQLAVITSIRREVLGASQNIIRHHISAAERMSWAANRQTAREEDMAYSLFGLFGVNLPLLYGEGGPRAFIRLQSEILRTMDDYTLLAWSENYAKGGRAVDGLNSGALSIHVANFVRLNINFDVFKKPAPKTGGKAEKSSWGEIRVLSKHAVDIPSELQQKSKDSRFSPPHRPEVNQEIGTPSFTSRGILVTLLACRTPKGAVQPSQRWGPTTDEMIVAWPFSQVSIHRRDDQPAVSEYVGIHLALRNVDMGVKHWTGEASVQDTAFAGRTVAAYRTKPKELVRIPVETLLTFVPVTMYLETTAAFGDTDAHYRWCYDTEPIAQINLSENICLSATYPELQRHGEKVWVRATTESEHQRLKASAVPVIDGYETVLYFQRQELKSDDGMETRECRGIVVVVGERRPYASKAYGICYTMEHNGSSADGEVRTPSPQYLRSISDGFNLITQRDFWPDRVVLKTSGGGVWRISVKKKPFRKDCSFDEDPHLILSVSYEEGQGES